MKSRHYFFYIIGVITLLFLNPIIVFSQKADSVKTQSENWDRLSVSLGGFLAHYNSGIIFGSQQLGFGIQIDIEDALGLESSQFAFRGNAVYKFGKKLKHSATFGYFGIVRSAHKTLVEDLVLGDVTFPTGTQIKSKFDLTILRVKYDYAFYQDDRVSLGASLGLFIMPIGLTVKANSSQDQTTQFTAPLPLLGLRSDFKITDKLSLSQSVEILYLSVGEFTGSLLDFNIALEHKTFNHLAFGIAVNSNRFNINITNPRSTLGFFGDIKMDYTGLLFYGKYYL